MIAYGFKKMFAPQLESGAKTLTLRRFRKPPSRHVEVGEPAGLWTGMRTKEAKRNAVWLTVVRGLVRVNEAGVRDLSDLRVRDAADAYIQAMLADIGHGDALARRDGFENWASAWAWHDANRDKEERGAASLVRELVGGCLLNAEQVAALENGSARIEEAV